MAVENRQQLVGRFRLIEMLRFGCRRYNSTNRYNTCRSIGNKIDYLYELSLAYIRKLGFW